MTTERLLLCRPLGGLNDMLCQIENACRYAERYDRTVIVDTRHHSKTYFRDSFSTYFASRQQRLVLDAEPVLAELDRFDVFPHFLAGRVGAYAVRFDRELQRFVEDQTGLVPSFDFARDYGEPLLVHHASGGGIHGVGALARLRLSPELADLLIQRHGRVGPDYSGVHVRNTDYKARYEQTMVSAKIDPSKPIFLATDNRATLAYFHSIFGPEAIHAFSRLPEVAGERLHHIGDAADAYERNSDCILDVLLLGLASRLYLFELEPNPYGARYSGYSVLAANLQNSKPVLRDLISTDPAVLAAVGLHPG